MYGQGNHVSQLRPGPPALLPQPAPLPSFQQPPPPLPIHQGLPQARPPPPPPYSQQPVRPPPTPMNMGQPYFHPPPPYPQPGPSYSHLIPQPMPPPPRVFPIPRPPPQGQVMYRPLPPPPFGIQHLPAPPPPYPTGFALTTPSPYASFGQNEAHPPFLPPPPPPPPPSSPPPLPPSPPPPASPILDCEGPSMDKEGSPIKSEDDCRPSVLRVHHGGVVGAAEKDVHLLNGGALDDGKASRMKEGTSVTEKKVFLVKGETLRGLASPPSMPKDEGVVKNIEVLCQFIQKFGPSFEEKARLREVGNPRFSFLFGGETGSAAAIGHAYFQWMKMKCQLKSEHHEDLEYATESAKLEDKGEAYSPADSDMDMDDDASHPDEGRGLDNLSKNSKDSDVHVVNELLHATQDTRQLEHEIRMSSSVSCSEPTGSLKFVEDKKVDDDSLFMEDLRPSLTMLAHAEGAIDGNVRASIRPSTEDLTLAKCLSAVASCKSEDLARVFVKDGSPFRLIQGYASDDSGEDNKGEEAVNVTPVRTSPAAAIGFSGIKEDEGSELYSSCSLKESSSIVIISETKTGLSKPTPPVMTKTETSGSSPRNPTLRTGWSKPCPVDATEEDTDLGSHQQGDHKCDDNIVPVESSQHIDNVKSDGIYIDKQVGKFRQQEDAKEESPTLAVDEFGRLLRKAATDSDSDGMDSGERSMKRGRSQSRSRSPQRNRWRRRSRSPRRREKRSVSRSWSPKRSRSPPAFRRTSEFARRDRDQPPECFNFIRGRCFRGASCRFVHRDFGRHRSRQQEYPETLEKSRNYSLSSDASFFGKSDPDKAVAKEMDVDGHHNIVHEVKNPVKDEDLDEKVVSGSSLDKTQFSDEYGAGCLVVDEKGFSELNTQGKEAQEVEKIQEAPDTDHIEKESTQSLSFQPPSADSLLDQPLLSDKTQVDGTSTNLDRKPTAETQTVVQIVVSAAAQNQSPATQTDTSQGHDHVFPNYVPAGQAPVQSLPENFPPPNFSAPHYQPSQLATPAPLGPSFMSYPSHPPSSDMTASHQPPISREFHSFTVSSSNPSWSSYPQPPPLHASGPPQRPAFFTGGNPFLQLQQNAMPPSSNSNFHPSVRPYIPGELTRPRGVDMHPQPSHSMDSSHQTSHHMDEVRQRPMPVGNWNGQPFVREDQFAHLLMPGDPQFLSASQRDHHLHRQSFSYEEAKNPILVQGYTGSSSFLQGNLMHPQHPPVPRESIPNQPYSVTEFHPPPRFSSREEHPPRHSQGLFAQQQPSSSSYPSNNGAVMVDSSRPTFPSSIPASTLPPHLSDFGATKVSTHYNPFASTFEQPLASLKFASSVGGHGSRITASPPNQRRSVEQFLPREGGMLPISGGSSAHAYTRDMSADMPRAIDKQFVREPAAGDPYDPLFDSIEPSSNMFRKIDSSREELVNDVATMSHISALRKSGDVEENNRQKFVAPTALKSEADELGEVATDAEVGDVENASPQPENEKEWSPGIRIDIGNTATGEIEIDQVQTPGRSKKSKDSRSMKLFRIALADFVKEILKPSWRQGNMSKEAFKTIVKKTVDKVSGAMSSHQIPKTQAKINQYVESSQRKLTKLVTGYVEKYVKM